MEILVGYASVAASAKEVAAHLAAQLAERGSTVTCVPIGTSPDPAGFDAVIVGSAVHGQAWLPEAVDWLRTSRDVLAGRPVWAFSVGMPAAVGRPFRRLALREGPKIATALGELIPLREHRLFSGVVAEETFRGSSRWVFRLMGCKYGDFRDWQTIGDYAEHIADQLDAMART